MSCFGKLFKVTTFGESHGKAVGVTVEGVPSNMNLDVGRIQSQLDRRRPGQSTISTDRKEEDKVEIICGLENGVTLGYPITAIVFNKDMRREDYSFSADGFVPRPSHADYTYLSKYGIHASSGGGRSSARETIGRVIAGAIAQQVLHEQYDIEIVSWVKRVGHIQLHLPYEAYSRITPDMVDSHVSRCPDKDTDARIVEYVTHLKTNGDSTGGIVTCVARNVMKGLGEPVFDKMEAELAHAMLSIPACKGFEIGKGFKSAEMKGSDHNDPFVCLEEDGVVKCAKNDAGGVLGGITNGELIYFNLAFKPPATIRLPQRTCGLDGTQHVLEGKGRHDPCVVNRAVPIVEAMCAMVLLDNILIQNSRIEMIHRN